MISLMNANEKQTAEKNLRTLYLERLQEIAEDAQSGGDSVAGEAADAELTEMAIPEPVQADVTLPGRWPGETSEAFDSDQFRLLAEQIAPKCIEALAEAMRGMHRLADGERGKAEDAIHRLIALSDEIRHINGEISSLHESTEFLTGAERDLATKTAGLEGQLAECAASDRQVMADLQELACAQAQDRKSQALANSATEGRLNRLEHSLTERLNALEKRVTASLETVSFASEHLEAIAQALETCSETTVTMSTSLSRVEETQQVLQRRLDNQAEVLRKLYASEQERGSQLQTVLQRMKEMTVGFFMPAPLPEEL